MADLAMVEVGGHTGSIRSWICPYSARTGENPDGWILRAKQYFKFYRLSEECMEASVVVLEGDVLLWYQCESARQPVKRWEDMKTPY